MRGGSKINITRVVICGWPKSALGTFAHRGTLVEKHCSGGITLVQSDNCVQQLPERQEKKITEAEMFFL